MGYTHYWRQPQDFEKHEWDELLRFAREAFKRAPLQEIKLRKDSRSMRPAANASEIRFNGVGAEAYETFVLRRKNREFDFCKTARKAYDPVVCSILLAARLIGGRKSIRISSDGEVDSPSWSNAIHFYNDIASELRLPLLNTKCADELLKEE